uniref:Uncharacterized protein n=1 Tax=Panagrolaimus davidi TaxID=227884 RepID=A0A914QQ44_9BILA
MKFSEVIVVDLKQFEINERIPHRFDYNLFYNEQGAFEIIDFETYSFTWTKKLVFAHSSYWKSTEVIALMTNIMSRPVLENYIPRTVADKKNINRRSRILSAFLVICRLFCTMSLVNHTKPLFSVAVLTQTSINGERELLIEYSLIYMVS